MLQPQSFLIAAGSFSRLTPCQMHFCSNRDYLERVLGAINRCLESVLLYTEKRTLWITCQSII